MVFIGFTVAYLEDISYKGAQIPKHKVAMVTKFCTVAPNICGTLVWNLLHVTCLVPRTFEVAPTLLENLCTPGIFYQFL
jgi:hypothetical protein